MYYCSYRRVYLCLNSLGFSTLLLFQSIGSVAFLLVAKCPVVGSKSLSPHFKSRYIPYRTPLSIAIIEVYEGNHYIFFSPLNGYTSLSVTYWRWSFGMVFGVVRGNRVLAKLDVSWLRLSLTDTRHLSYFIRHYSLRVSLLRFSRKYTTFSPNESFESTLMTSSSFQ